MEITGQIYAIFNEVQVTERFSKREFVIETADEYPQHVLCQLTQDKCSMLDKFGVGQEVEVSINLRGKKYIDKQGVTKFFNSIEVWKMKSNEVESQEPQQRKVDTIDPKFQDDMPF